MYNTYTKASFKTSHGKALRKIRVHVYDMSQADFAKNVLRCSQAQVCNMELGKTELNEAAKKLVNEYATN